MTARYVPGSTGIVVTVPEAEAVLHDLRSRYDPAVAAGVPPHITVLYPWLPSDRLGASDLAALAELAAGVTSFEARLAETGRFPGVAWLAPEPLDAFAGLTGRAAARWPETPPYEGRFADVVPHLTVADAQPEEVLDVIAELLLLLLPIRFAVRSLQVMRYDGSRWHCTDDFPLG